MKDELIALMASIRTGTGKFTDVISFIENYYSYQPTAFKNGDTYNQATQNQGSAKVLAFGRLNNLSRENTLLLFAEHHQSVLDKPDASDHQNIRQFIANGWDGVVFESQALTEK